MNNEIDRLCHRDLQGDQKHYAISLPKVLIEHLRAADKQGFSDVDLIRQVIFRTFPQFGSEDIRSGIADKDKVEYASLDRNGQRHKGTDNE